jgi:anaerobic magnesium-protoporphyrin IX monomethyl ester cyclase
MPETKLALVSLTRDVASPPLGLASIATYLRQEGVACETRIADVNFGNPLKEVLDFQPDLVGISAFSVQMPDAVRLARKVCEHLDAPLILGGVHISTLPESLPPEFDLGVIGEGEQTTLEMVVAFQRHGHLRTGAVRDIGGLVFREDGTLTCTPRRALANPLDRIPIPDRSFVHPGYFLGVPLPALDGRKVRTTAFLTGRGCPYRCSFCSTTAFWGNRIRYHSVDHVMEEIRYLVEEYGIEHLMIWDDLFAVNRKRVAELADALRETGLLGRVKFSCQMRANLMDEEMAQILWDLGVVSICFGFESGSEKTLKYLKQSVTVEQNKAAIQVSKARGFYVVGGLIFGSPGEKLADMEETLGFMDYLREASINNAWCFTATPFPGTPMWEDGLARGLLGNDMDFGELNLYRPLPLLLDDSVTPQQFRKLMRRARAKLRAIRAPQNRLRVKLLLADPITTVKSFVIQRLLYRDWLGLRLVRRKDKGLHASR